MNIYCYVRCINLDFVWGMYHWMHVTRSNYDLGEYTDYGPLIELQKAVLIAELADIFLLGELNK